MTDGSQPRRDESVTFSLRELMKLEEDRVDRERRAREEAQRAEARAREEAERRAAEERDARERAEAEAREAERRRALDELARREAMHKAVVEQARIEVEARTRAEEAERERRHELELARVRTASRSPSVGTAVLAALGAAAITMAACLALYLGALRPDADRRIAALEAAALEGRAREADLSARLEDARRATSDAQRELEQAKRELANRSAPPPPAPSTGRHGAGQGPRHPTQAAPRRTGTPCLPRDPMCFDLDPPR